MSSGEEDWDAEIAKVPAPAQQPGAGLYHMSASGGMVTITPAGQKVSNAENAEAVKAPLFWGGRNNEEVLAYTSYDDFDKGWELKKADDGFHGEIELPPGRYLIRYKVDGDYEIDEDQEVVCSLGNEYNTLIIDGDGDDSAESEEWSDLEDEELPDEFGTNQDLSGLDTSKGMITFSPEQMDVATDVMAGRARASSLKWDHKKNAFVIDDVERPQTITEEEAKNMTPEERKKLKDRERRRRKKKRRKEKLRLQKSGAAKKEDIAAIKAEIGRREREWREAWILHEMKTNDLREKETSALKEQMKEQREEWMSKIAQLESENQNLRVTINKQETSLEEAKSGAGVSAAAVERARKRHEEEKEQLLQQHAATQAEVEALKEQLKNHKNEQSSLDKSLEESKSAWHSEKALLANEVTQAKAELDRKTAELASLKEQEAKLLAEQEATKAELLKKSQELQSTASELDESKKMLGAKESEFEERQKDYERKLQHAMEQVGEQEGEKEETAKQVSDLLAEIEKVKADHRAALEKRDQDAHSQRSELKADIDKKEQQIQQLTSDLASAKKESSAATTDLQAKLDTVSAELERVKVEKDNASTRVSELESKVEKLSAERSSLEADYESKQTALKEELAKVRESQQDKATQLDAALGELDTVKEKLKLQEAASAREKAELERQLEVVKSRGAKLTSKLKAVSEHSTALHAGVKALKESQIRETASLQTQMENTKKFLLQAVSAQAELLNVTMKKYKKEMSERRKYFNLVQELRGNIRVFCRCRPYNDKADGRIAGNKQAVEFTDENALVVTSEKRSNDYEFDRVFAPGTTQEEVFTEIADLIKSCMDGYNVCIFAYGQTGSGKTYTMEGPPDNRGVNFRALSELFGLRDSRKGDYRYKISVSMLEIYNETIRDLLDPTDDGKTKSMKIRKGPNGMWVENLTEWEVDNEDDVLKAMAHGGKNRSVGITNMNEHSSRSHSLLSVKVVGQNLAAGITYYGKLHLIDLAGSERVGRSGATGQRLKEAQAINKSLSALGNVIESLQKKNSHCPYRDSKLTFLLQDSLGGHAKTLMFINISPSLADAEETFCSLNFALRVRKVELGSAVKTVVQEKGHAVEASDKKKRSVRKKATK